MSLQSVNAIRFLGVDAINKSNSGHPGIVMGAAPMAYSLFTKHLRITPEQPNWINRDRFILSAGHGSMLLYALLHLTGYNDVSMDEIKNFRQWGSKTPGHPEVTHTSGVDATSGPLGQGISTAVGFAQAERFLAAKYNKDGFPIFDHYTYVIAGDGDFMEGVSAEAASYAGHQALDKLIVLYDSNDICLDGETKDTFSENVRARYDAYGWHTVLVEDGTDLAHSNMTYIKADGLQDKYNPLNRNIQFGVREFAMGTILNGMALHGGLRVYGGTFFVFSDYVKAAIRLSAIQELPVTYVFTHDSIAVGEDGPTHEPVEHLAGLRSMPNLTVIRPADARETQAAWHHALTSTTTPTVIVLTRQNLVVEEGTDFGKVAKGAYVVYDTPGFDTIIIATGSEVNLAIKAAKELVLQGGKVRVVSMPSTELFDAQDATYKEDILPSKTRRRVAIEMAATQSWYKYVGLDGAVIGIDIFGASAPAQTVIDNYGFTVENIVAQVKSL